MSESTEEQPTADAPGKSGKGSKLAIILAAVNFVAVLGLGGYFFYTQQHAAAQAKKGDAKDAHGAAKEEAAAPAGEHGEAAPSEGAHGEQKAEAGGHGAAKPGAHGATAEAETASPHGDEGAGKGPLLALDPLVTNLADPDSDRYLKVAMQMRITSEAAKAEVEANLVPVRNQILIYLSSLTMEDTSGADNKREIQKRVKRIANEAMPSSRITQVYFTEFVIQ